MSKKTQAEINQEKRSFLQNAARLSLTFTALQAPSFSLAKPAYNIGFWRMILTATELQVSQTFAMALVAAPATAQEVQVSQTFAMAMVGSAATAQEVQVSQVYAQAMVNASYSVKRLRVSQTFAQVLVSKP